MPVASSTRDFSAGHGKRVDKRSRLCFVRERVSKGEEMGTAEKGTRYVWKPWRNFNGWNFHRWNSNPKRPCVKLADSLSFSLFFSRYEVYPWNGVSGGAHVRTYAALKPRKIICGDGSLARPAAQTVHKSLADAFTNFSAGGLRPGFGQGCHTDWCDALSTPWILDWLIPHKHNERRATAFSPFSSVASPIFLFFLPFLSFQSLPFASLLCSGLQSRQITIVLALSPEFHRSLSLSFFFFLFNFIGFGFSFCFFFFFFLFLVSGE